jgi:hypothetical protein
LPSCNNTADVVKVAVALWLKIKDSKPDEEPDGEPDQPEGEEGEEGEGEDKGDDGETPNGDSPSDKPSDEPEGEEGDEDEGSTGGNGSGKGAVKNIHASDLIESQARDMSGEHVFKLPLRTKTIIGKFIWG